LFAIGACLLAIKNKNGGFWQKMIWELNQNMLAFLAKIRKSKNKSSKKQFMFFLVLYVEIRVI